MTAHLLIEEDRLDAVTGHAVGFEVAEELEEQPPFLWHGISRSHPTQILLVVPAGARLVNMSRRINLLNAVV